MLRKLLAPLAAAALLLTLAGCVTAPASADPVAPTVAVASDTIVLDVRTPGEYAGGHLEGAELLDLTGGDFATALPGLDPEAEYVVYCRSGNRSSQAVSMMVQAGFANVIDLGSMENAATATGLDIVTR